MKRCRWVSLFIGTDLEECSIPSLAHQWILCSEWVPSLHQLMSCEVKCCMFVRNKSIIKTFLTSNCCFQLNYNSSIIILLPEKVVWSESEDNYSRKHYYKLWTFKFSHSYFTHRFFTLQVIDYLYIIVMFLSAVWTLILTAPIHCRGSISEQVI